MKIPISKTKTRKNTKEDLSKHQETLIDNNLRDGHERDTLFDSKSKLDVKKIKHKQKGTTPKDITSKTKIIFKEPESSAENKELVENAKTGIRDLQAKLKAKTLKNLLKSYGP